MKNKKKSPYFLTVWTVIPVLKYYQSWKKEILDFIGFRTGGGGEESGEKEEDEEEEVKKEKGTLV